MLVPYLQTRLVFPFAELLSGRKVLGRVRAINRELQVPWAQREVNNRARLAEMVQWAQYEIPFYRDLFSRLKFDPAKLLKDARYLDSIPVLTKADLLEAGDRIMHPEAKAHLVMQVSRTNGSTGASLPVYYSSAAKDEAAAVGRISREWIGFSDSDTQLHISSQLPGEVPVAARQEEWWRRLATNRISVECESWTDEHLDGVWQTIRRHRPFLVQGHPSTLYHLANFLRERGELAGGAFKVFVSTGEKLGDEQRAVIEAVFGCKVADRYGNAEFGIIAHERFSPPARSASSGIGITPDQARDGRHLQIFDPCVWVEALPATPGTPGPLIVTSLVNFAAPLIRYVTGDESRVVKGSDGVYLDRIEGRVHDVVMIAGSRYSTSYIQDLLSREMHVNDFQFVEGGERGLELRIALHNSANETSVRAQIEQTLGRDAVALSFVPRERFIRVGRQQKFRYVVNI